MTTDDTASALRAVGPAIRRRRLAADLRRLRELAGLTIVQAAEMLEWSSAKISRIESAQVSVLPRDARLLAGIYGVGDGDDRERLIAMARQTRQKPWWNACGLAVPVWFQPYAALEAEAAALRSYHPELVPGLLQTPAYRAFVIPGPPGMDDWDATQLATLLLARQHRRAATGTPRMHAIVSEAVLRRPIGGPDVMVAQLAHLTQASQQPDVTIQVLPFAAGAHPAMDTPFTLLAFPDSADPVIVSPGSHPGLCLGDTAMVQHYQRAFTCLHQMALSAQASRELIAQAASELVSGR